MQIEEAEREAIALGKGCAVVSLHGRQLTCLSHEALLSICARLMHEASRVQAMRTATRNMGLKKSHPRFAQ